MQHHSKTMKKQKKHSSHSLTKAQASKEHHSSTNTYEKHEFQIKLGFLQRMSGIEKEGKGDETSYAMEFSLSPVVGES